MKFISKHKIHEELVYYFNKEETFEIDKGLENDKYISPFDGLNDLHLLNALVINKPKVSSNYIHFLEQERFDEK